ncbi:MAG: YceH family protein [Chloroflexota bacterium]|nr:YceH family protein [Chloroflexota bacterium]
MDIALNDTEVRVLGCLIEKKVTTPEYYPLSVNALNNACNQLSNRNPVVCYDEYTVIETLEGLRERDMVWRNNSGRVQKYGEKLAETCGFTKSETAIICILMLRGPQTAGEIRAHTERLYQFKDLGELTEILTGLEDTGHIAKLARRPGHKESRYIHLFSGVLDPMEQESVSSSQDVNVPVITKSDRFTKLEQEIESLRQEMEELKQSLQDFRKQFE